MIRNLKTLGLAVVAVGEFGAVNAATPWPPANSTQAVETPAPADTSPAQSALTPRRRSGFAWWWRWKADQVCADEDRHGDGV